MNSNRVLVIVPLSLGLLFAVPARAASLQKVNQSEWGVSGLPSYVNMYIYVPDKPATKPPILVASHHCQGTASGFFSEVKSLVSLADKNGFIMIFPEATGHNCWDVGSDKSLKHDGGGDTQAIAQMVKYTITKYSADASRVYGFGTSSGAMMTQALMGVYPDVFMGGVEVSGVPCGCWAVDYSGDVSSNGQWSNPCANGTVTHTAEEWGTLVRAMFPGFTGHRPRLQLWHGNPDPTINFNNFGEAIKEWTNLLGLGTTPTATDSSISNTTHQTWKSAACDFTVLETFEVKGAGHSVNYDVSRVSSFLGLDKAGTSDPETAACGATGGTSSGTGGASSSGGSTAAAGTGGRAGGVGGAAAAGRDGGRGGLANTGTSTSASSAAPNTGGVSASAGGKPAVGGSSGNAATNGGASAVATGAGPGSGGSTTGDTSSASQNGGTSSNTKPTSSGASSAVSNSFGTGSGETPASGGASKSGSSSANGGSAQASEVPAPSDAGCGCVVGGNARRPPFSAMALLLAAIGLVSRRQRRA
jgi:acetylxylan esterase